MEFVTEDFWPPKVRSLIRETFYTYSDYMNLRQETAKSFVELTTLAQHINHLYQLCTYNTEDFLPLDPGEVLEIIDQLANIPLTSPRSALAVWVIESAQMLNKRQLLSSERIQQAEILYKGLPDQKSTHITLIPHIVPPQSIAKDILSRG